MADPTKVYKYALFLPILVPILVAPILYFGLQSLGEKLGLIIIIIFYSGIVGGIPYLLLAIGLAVWMKEKSEREIRKALIISPIIMAGFTAILVVVLRFVPSDQLDVLRSASGFFGVLAVLTIFIGIFGYAYVCIAFTIARVVRGHAFGAFTK
jgi:hypothetical protein